MNTTGQLPEPVILLALAQAALLDQLDRDDASHARKRLLVDLALAWGRQTTLSAPDQSHPTLTQGGELHLPLRHLDQALGQLCVSPGADLPPLATAQALSAVTRTLASLLARERADAASRTASQSADPSAGPADGSLQATGSHGQLIRAALVGAGTFVWEWDIPSDRRGDIDEGFELLGYAPSNTRRTQRDWDSLIHPDDLAANHDAYLEHASGRRAYYEHIYRARSADGHWRWLQERGRIVEWCVDGSPQRMVGTQADITERRQADAEAQVAMARLRKIAAHVPGALFQFQRQAGGEGSFPYLSERSLALFGLPPESVMQDGSAMLRRIERSERQAVALSIAASAATLQPWVQEFSVHRPDGALRRIRGSATPQPEADGSTVWHGYFEDVTEAHALAQAQREKSVAEAANRSKTEFLSRMSHELRTPLNAVLGFAQLMAIDSQHPLSPDQLRRVSMIEQSGAHLLALIDDLLDLTGIEAGRQMLNLAPVPLKPLLDDALAMVQAAAMRSDLKLHYSGDGPDPKAWPDVAAWADAKRLRQVLLNLLTNAVKYNRPGGSVQVWADVVVGQARLQVQDTGLGMSADECLHLFEPFNRLGQAHGLIEGTGIGLTLSRALVQLMGGELSAVSTPGQGSTFSVTLPLAPPALTALS